jgi:ribosomal protein S27AE
MFVPGWVLRLVGLCPRCGHRTFIVGHRYRACPNCPWMER